jgi:hypothetical protein
MKAHEHELLNQLESPLSRADSFSLNITRFFTDASGTIIAKAAAPIAMQTKYPFYLFNYFDKKGGYFIGQKICPSVGYFYLYSFTQGNAFNWFDFNGFNNIKAKINIGDIVHVYADNPTTPNFFVWVVQSSPFQSFASIVDNTNDKNLDIKEALYFTDNVANFNEPLYLVKENIIGVYNSDMHNPLSFRTLEDKQQDFIKLKIKLTINQYFGLYSYFDFQTEKLTFEFKLVI